MTTARAVVIDDELLARAALRDLLGESTWVTVVGEAENGNAGLQLIGRERPDIAFIDIQMPGLNGIELVQRLPYPAVVIFTTAHDDYALTAFELGAIDYLRKPFGSARLIQALDRVRPFLNPATRDDAPLAERLGHAQRTGQYVDRLFVRSGTRIVPIAAREIERCEAAGDYVALHVGGRRHLLYINLGELTERLDPGSFVRVHRSHLVNLDYVSALRPIDANRVAVAMRDGSTVIASRTGTAELRNRARLLGAKGTSKS